jgi:hypothetical protein
MTHRALGVENFFASRDRGAGDCPLVSGASLLLFMASHTSQR